MEEKKVIGGVIRRNRETSYSLRMEEESVKRKIETLKGRGGLEEEEFF